MRTLSMYVRDFMEAGEQPTLDSPDIPDRDTVDLGMTLIDQELQELNEAIDEAENTRGYGGPSYATLAKVGDAIADLLYVVTWNGLAWGMPMQAIMEEVQRANMEKFGLGSWKDETGKVMKPPGWKPPDIEAIIKSHREPGLRKAGE